MTDFVQHGQGHRTARRKDRAVIVFGVVVAIFCLTPWELILR